MYSLILHGRRAIELQKWRNLRCAVKLLEYSLSSAATASGADDASLRVGRKGKNFTVSYLVDSLGLAKKLAESISRKVSLENKVNPDSVLNLLRSHGFTDSHISSIVREYPRLLILDAERSLAPKLKYLQSRGDSNSELTETVSKVPKILRLKAGKSLSTYYDFVKVIIKADKISKFKKLCHSLPEGSIQENKTRNISVLRDLGVPQRLLFSLFTSVSPPVCGKERFEESLKKVVEMGFDPTTSKFVSALRVFQGLSDKTVEEKVNFYITLGLSVEDVWAMFKKFPCFLGLSEKKTANSIETFIGLGLTRDEFTFMVKRFPSCLNFSAESVKKKTEFLVKKMNWPLKTVVLNPVVLGYSLEKRIVPRCNVIRVLISKGFFASEHPPMPSALAISDRAFLNKYVLNHDDKRLVPKLIAVFSRKRVSLTDHVVQ
ncbi:hypothetical protein CARUB_v10021637mg [Capsella rubella]|uniref:Mitochondrial transcription termination factor family protein n=1 Tax=Capsella rubella TaxID=81985 RepID=R0I7R8_9BRAS|nr:hypothetical protein CARUB_v10021637mg [Capsella rubella]